ncbi:MAG: FAD:protein FMN transferase [Planctomycetota bacterium]
MATQFVVMLAPSCADKVDVVLDALESLDGIEARWTVFRDNSEIRRLNRAAGQQPLAVSSETFAILQRAIKLSKMTGGAFDVTAGPLIDAWGFAGQGGRKPTPNEIGQARQKVGIHYLTLDETNRTAFLTRPGMRLNLGAIGKGDALDRLADRLLGNGVTDFLIHGGQSSVLARGDQDPQKPTGWAVGVSHPTKPSIRLAGLWLKDGALATSGSGKQFFHHRGRRFGHVIDPRTGHPAGDLLSLTVITDRAADADAIATGLFVLGSQPALEVRETLSELRVPRHPSSEHCDAQSPQDQSTVPVLLVRPASRQDGTEIQVEGEFHWIDPPRIHGDLAGR